MRLLKKIKKREYEEIEVERSTFWSKKRIVKYRMSDGSIMRFESPDNYYEIGFEEYIKIMKLFKMPAE